MEEINNSSILDSKPASSVRSGTSRKRVRRACDECRLHKSRCDGRQGCETCLRHNRVCTYILLPTECKGSAARIRVLERRLIKAKEHIQHLGSPRPISVNPYENIVPEKNARFSAPLGTTVAGHVYPTIGTSIGIIEALLSPLFDHRDIRALLNSDATRQILCNSPTYCIINNHPQNPFCCLPSYDIMLQVASSAFNNIFGLCGIISEQCFHTIAQKLYHVDPLAYTREEAQFVPLFCGIMTLGMLDQPEIESRYHHDLRESLQYFGMISSSIDNKRVYSSISELQTGLVLVLYFVNTSKLNLAHYLLQSVASSPIFCAVSQGSIPTNSGTQSVYEPTKDISWVAVYLDMHVSLFLGVTTQFACPISSIYLINIALRNITIYKRSDTAFLLSVALAIGAESLRLIQYMVHDTITDLTKSHTSPDELPISTNSQRWAALEIELGTLESAFRRIFPEDDANPQISSARNQLLMYFCMSRIMLHFRFLSHHSQSLATNDPQRVCNIRKGRTCVMAASNVITSVSDRMKRLQTTMLTWLSGYTIFMSIITLLVAMVASEHEDVYTQCTIEHTIRVAFQILKHATYGAERHLYITFLLAISTKTNVQFEFALRNDVLTASTTDRSSCRSESSQISRYPDLGIPFDQSGQSSNAGQWRTPTMASNIRGDWGFD